MHEHLPGPSGPGSVVLELGPGIGALVLHTPRGLDGREIEVSPLGGAAVGRTHSLVRPRTTGRGTQYAAVYPELAAGTYTVWGDAVTPVATVTIHGGEVTEVRWPERFHTQIAYRESDDSGSHTPRGRHVTEEENSG